MTVGRRAEVLSVLRAADAPLNVAEIADRLAIHPNTVRFHLDTLLESGRAQRVQVDHGKRGRPTMRFRATPGMDPAGPRRYRLLAEVLVGELAAEPDASRRAVDLGRRWGERLARSASTTRTQQPVGRLMDLLAALAFAPQHDSLGATTPASSHRSWSIGLHNCPFLELVPDHADVLCPLHLGLMEGALTAWRAPVGVESLTPFAHPDRCVAQLTPSGGPA